MNCPPINKINKATASRRVLRPIIINIGLIRCCINPPKTLCFWCRLVVFFQWMKIRDDVSLKCPNYTSHFNACNTMKVANVTKGEKIIICKLSVKKKISLVPLNLTATSNKIYNEMSKNMDFYYKWTFLCWTFPWLFANLMVNLHQRLVKESSWSQ